MTTTRTQKTASPLKLQSGEWGVKVTGSVEPGDTVTVITRLGKSWQATIDQVLQEDSKTSVCSTRSAHRRGRTRRMGSGSGSASPVPGYARYCTDRVDCGCYDCAS